VEIQQRITAFKERIMPKQKVLIPLDGSKLAEQALLTMPFLQSLGIEIVQLVSVFEHVPSERTSSQEYNEYLQKSEAAAGAYLRSKAENISAGGIEARYMVRFGLAAEEIVREAEDCAVDLIVLASRGRVGPDRWSPGSVADEVVRLSSGPVLMIGPHAHVGIGGFMPRRLMVPLDGSLMAEVALAPARYIADRTGADIHLVRVALLPGRWVSPFGPYDPVADMDASAREANAYLSKVPAGVDARRALLRAGFVSNVSDELIRYCGNTGIDLVVMTSHTRVGASRLLLGGVADDLLRGSAPVLVLKPGEAKTSSLFAPVAEKVGG
jgi:nucleotide-binding universal stress UspA family protein